MLQTLRPHQQQGTDDIEGAWRSGRRRVLYQLPTGGGKTHIKAAIAKRAVESGMRVFALAHRRELVGQISARMAAFGIKHGIIQPGEPFNPWMRVQVCAVQTLNNRLLQLPDAPDLILIDEAHHAVAGTWRNVLDHWPNALVLGVTATPERLDGKGLGDVFDHLICGPSVLQLQAAGFLAAFKWYAPPKNAEILKEMRKARTRAGDFARDELEIAVNKRVIVGNAIDEYRKHLDGKPAIAFCVGVKHAKDVADQFIEQGYRAASVDGSMPTVERNAILRDFATGRLSILTSADLISEGFDVPECAGALLLRPTKSRTIFLQQVGRALRPKSDGSPAVIIDHAGNCYEMGLPSDAIEWSLEGRKKKDKDAEPVTQCMKCYRVFDKETVKEARRNKECPGGETDQFRECGLWDPKSEGVDRRVQFIDGELTEITPEMLKDMDRPAWSGGISLSLATGIEFETLLARANTYEKLRQIAKARGYKAGWAWHRWEAKRASAHA